MKNWQLMADGIFRYIPSETLFERPCIDGRRTYRSLGTCNLKLAKEELHKRRSNPNAYVKPVVVTAGEVLARYRQDGYPDRQKQQRPEAMRSAEEANCETLSEFWNSIKIDDVTIAICDRYHAWRKARVTRGTGDRTVDLELNTLNNAMLWATRCEIIRHNPLSDRRPKYCVAKNVRHCREFMPHDADELHKIAGLLFRNPRSEVLGWQVLVEACTGLRTTEVLQLRTDAGPYEAGWITPDGKSLSVRRAKGQESVNPFVGIRDDLRQTLDALFRWKREWFPDSPWFFPSTYIPGAAIDGSALAHAMARRVSPKFGRKLTSHGLRAFYVTARRSYGIPDIQIAWEIGHTSGGQTLADVYGGAPPHWLAGDGPKMSFLPAGEPVWSQFWSAEDKVIALPPSNSVVAVA